MSHLIGPVPIVPWGLLFEDPRAGRQASNRNEEGSRISRNRQPGLAAHQTGKHSSFIQKAETLAPRQKKVKDQALIAEAAISTLVRTLNLLPLRTVDCLAELLPKIFPDYEIVKQKSLHQTKADYIFKFGVAKRTKEKILIQMRAWQYSLNSDENVKGGNCNT